MLQMAQTDKHYMPFQEEGIAFARDKAVTLIADEQGLGKTVQGVGVFNDIGAFMNLYPRVLVVCPASVKINWKREFCDWSGINPDEIQIISSAKDAIQTQAKIVIINYDLVAKDACYERLLFENWGLQIYDEIQYLKNPKAKRTQKVLGYGRKKGISSKAPKILLLSGTPIKNRPIELWPLLKVLSPQTISPHISYLQYGRYFCAGYQDNFGWNMKGSKHEEELNTRLKSTIMIRRLKKDVLKELPDKILQVIPFEQSKGAKAILKREQEVLGISDMKKISLKELRKQDATIGALAEVRHDMAMLKLDACVKHIKDLLATTKKIVVFAWHRDIIEELALQLKSFSPVVVNGGVSQEKRQFGIDAFQKVDECRVFIGNIEAAGVGITLTSASTVVFVESSWVPGDIAQAIDRCHRIGQKDSVLAQFLVVQGSVEEYMLRTVVDKQRSVDKIVN